MIWAMAVLLAALSFGAIFWLMKGPRSGWEMIGAALLLGIAGYALQASPGLPGAPKASPAETAADTAEVVEARRALAGDETLTGDKWMMIGDALARNGHFSDAAAVLLGAVEKDPNNADAWLAMANALVAHADGTLGPAALLAYQRASNAAPDHPGPPFFLGLAMAQSGRLVEARGLWAELLARSPADAPWRSDLEQRLQKLDAFIAQNETMTPPPAGNPM